MMATLEVGYELKDVAEFLVASQGYAPIDGWNYEEILETLIAKKGRLTPEEFAESIVKNQINFSRNYKAGGRSMNLSCVDLKKAAGLRKALNNLVKVFNNILDKPVLGVDSEIAERNAVVRESVKCLIHHSHYFSQTYLHEQAVDISDFVKSLSANCDLKLKELELLGGKLSMQKGSNAKAFRRKLALIKTKCEEVETALKKYIELNRAFGADYQFSGGVSVFFPWTLLAYNMIYQKYNGLNFSRKSDWVKFIETFTKQTLRANEHPEFNKSSDYLTWISDVETANKADTARADTARADTAKGDQETFYKLFRRFRNHPIYHDVEIPRIVK